MSLNDLLQTVRRRKLYLIVPVLLSLLYFGYHAWSAEPYYESSTVLLAEQLDDYEALQPGAPVWIEDHIGAIRELVHRPSFLADLARDYDLYELDDGRVSTAAVADLSSRVWVKQEGEDTFSMGFTADEPQQVARVTAGMAEMFIERMTAARDTRTNAVNQVVRTELQELENKLEEQEAKIEDYKQRSGQSLPESLPTLMGEVASLRGEAQEKAAEIANLEAEREQVQTELAGMKERGVMDRDPELQELRTKLAELRNRYTDEHPEVVRVKQQIAALEETRSERSSVGNGDLEIRQIELAAKDRALDRKIAATRSYLQDIRSRTGRYEAQITAMPQREREMSDLMRDYRVTQEAYDELLARRHYTQVTHRLSKSSRGLTFVIVDPARVPTAPAGPQRWRPVLMGLVIGLAMAVLLTLVVEQVDTTVKDAEDVEQLTSMQVLAAIPSISTEGHPPGVGRSGQLRLPILYDPHGAAAEQYRILAMRIRRSLDDAGARTLMVTSGGGAEGKTTTAVNLAAAMSEQVSEPVLLVDCDLRRPRIHEYVAGRDENADPGRGLRYLLENPGADAAAPLTGKIGKLHVIADQEAAPDTYETLPDRTSEVLDRLASEYRYVILDAPPVVPMVDGHLLAEAADRSLFVVRAGKTPREVVQRAMELFDFSETLGIVVNDVDFRGKKYAGAYHYYEQHYAGLSRQEATP